MRVIVVVFAVLAGGWIALGHLATPPLLGWAAVASLGFAVVGNVLPERDNVLTRGAVDFIVFSSVMIGLTAAALVSGTAVLIGTAALAVTIVSSRIPERGGPFETLTSVTLAGLPLAYGALAVGRPSSGILPWILASWLQLIRVMVSELYTEPADRARGRRTVTIRLGRSRAAMLSAIAALAFIAASLVLPARAGYGAAYFLLALFAQLAVLAAAARLIVGRVDGMRQLLNGAMLIGAVALIAGRVT
jgi:4-hydroxybenzoate polyprenyltransferase